MNTNEQREEREWRRAIAILDGRIEDLKTRYDAEFRRLHSRLDAAVADLQGRLGTLVAVVEGDDEDAHTQRIAAKLDELRAQSDAAYDLLQMTLKPMGHNKTPSNQ